MSTSKPVSGDSAKEPKYRKNRLEKYLAEAKVQAPNNIPETSRSSYEQKRTHEKEAYLDIDALNAIQSDSGAASTGRLSRYELLERTLLNLPLEKLIKDTSANSIRSIRDKPVYTKHSFIAKYGDEIKNKTMEEIESNFVYDPKSKLVKDETKGFYNSKNGKYYRYLNSEGQELKDLEDTIRRENIRKGIQQKQELKKSGKRLTKEEFEAMNDRRSDVLFANPTLLAKRKRELAANQNQDGDEIEAKKRDLSALSAKQTSSGKKMNMDLLSKYK